MKVGDLAIPGDIIETPQSSDEGASVVLGPGLRMGGEGVVTATKCGIIRSKRNAYWLDNHQKRYFPNKGENVIGIVTRKVGDFFRVDIGSSESGMLSHFAFEGATNKNRPDIKIGDVVYAKLLVGSAGTETELVCVDSYGKEAGLGVLSGENSYIFSVPLRLVRKLLARDSMILSTLGKTVAFEIVVGMNGRVWVKSLNVRSTICIVNALLAGENMNEDQFRAMCAQLVEALGSVKF